MGRSEDIVGRAHRAYAWSQDIQIHYRRSGPAGRSPLLLLHGAQGTGALFQDLMSELGDERFVIAPDLPGAGMSDKLPGTANISAVAAAILDLVAELGLGMVDVLGLQEGGEIAVEMARQQPDVVRKLILAAAPAPVGLLSQPTLTLDMAGITAGAVRDFLDR